MTETKLYENFNWDDILVRSVIAGVLDLLNNQIDYSQVWDDNIKQTVKVPWMYSMGSSDERFVQDNYTFFGKKCFGDNMISGTFNSIPRGYLTYNGSKIESGSITNRFIQGRYMKNENGKLTSYTSFMYVMPLTIDFDCKVMCDNVLSALKIEQAIREVFYKNKSFYVNFRGMRIGCCAGFPEQMSNEIFKSTDYSFDNAQKAPMLTFSLSVETYHPVFDKTQEIEASKKIKAFGGDLYMQENIKEEKIEFVSHNDENLQYPAGVPYLIEWTHNSTFSEFLTVNLSYIDGCGCETVIENGINNQGFYIWNIPEDFGTFVQPTITFDIDEERVLKKPIIKIIPKQIPGKVGYYLTEDSFITLEQGFFVSSYEFELIPITIEYKTKEGKLVIVEGKYFLNLVDGRVSEQTPIVLTDGKINFEPEKFKGEVDFKEITLKITKAGYEEIFAKKPNVLIL